MDRARFETEALKCLAPDRIVRDAPLAPLTTFKVGGPADWLIDIQSLDELQAVMAAARNAGVPVSVLGGGSNVVIGDRGIRGAVLRLRLTSMSRPVPDRVRADAGVTINGLVRWTIGRGLAGLEAWAGTPGTVGGAVYGNAHYNGRNIGDLVEAATLLSHNGQLEHVQAAQLEFGYDTSRLKRTCEILLWAEFAVSPAETEHLRAVARASLAHRKRTQPLESPSAGCILQNPDPVNDRVPDGIPASAGALIDRAGLKNTTSGGARISSTHANFFINDGHATAQDIRALIERTRAAVRDRFGVELRDEIVMCGEF
jgi:UDP-N-acetylmuramate dehydrogenase